MSKLWNVWILLVFTILLAHNASGDTNQPHQFRKDQCGHCHRPAKDDGNVKHEQAVSSDNCITCHREVSGEMSHPIDVIPKKDLPDDMPLANGRLSCLTCHYAHPSSIQPGNFRIALLRKSGRGSHFCGACHNMDTNDHAVFETAHPGSRSPVDRGGALDAYTLQCVQCHDRHLRPWNSSRRWVEGRHSIYGPGKHPVGAAFVEIAARNPRRFNHPALLDKQVRLFDGKIGCGTCHSAYSKEENMLVRGNRESALCLQCHIK